MTATHACGYFTARVSSGAGEADMDAEARLIRWGGYAALAAVALMVLGGIVSAVAVGGEFGDSRRDASALAFLADNQAGEASFAWLIALFSALGIAAVLGFHAALRATKLPLVVGTVSATIGLVFWIMWALLYLGVVYDVAPAYAAADAASRAAIEAAGRGMLTASVAFDSVGFVFFGIGVLLFALAIFETRALPRWLGWFGLATGVVALVVGPTHWIESPTFLMLEIVTIALPLIWFAGMGINMVRGRFPAGGGAGGA